MTLFRDLVVPPELLAQVPASIATRYQVMPLHREDHTLHVAMADPLDLRVLDELRVVLGCEVRPTPAPAQEIREAIQRHYGLGAEAVERVLDGRTPTAVQSDAEDGGALVDDSSLASFVNQLIRQAVQDRATDIHLEPFEGAVRVRQRIDGMLLYPMVVSRIKVMARLDIAEHRLPQDGRMRVRLGEDEFDLRVSILPTSFGEGVGLRILSARLLYSLEQLGLAEDHRRQLSRLIEQPHGIILVTGPTGSGKTTTLYACLAKLNQTHRKILTIEDPIEYQLPGITQIQVHPKIGLTFAQGLRSMLRHDPDIMMVGEVRDAETAEITIRSALTGHLVFSTVHTNDAAGGIARLLDMGVEPYLVASSVLGFAAQRLVRVVCADCQESVKPAPRLAEQFGLAPPHGGAGQAGPGELPVLLRAGRGCPACNGTGYKGRTAIYEFLMVDETIQELILRRASSAEIVRAARAAGMRTLRQDGWAKILQGITTPEEVLRVT
ncbi:MAG: type II/IV secretion system protein [Candidatus Omnitrophica bacterium]|nr:type II/IV secretion system protein [Candidatus Omnitrophota bacterium]